MKIKSIYDNRGKTSDRYTIILTINSYGKMKPQNRDCLSLNNCPENPAYGISQFDTCNEGKHLGKKIKFEDLPKNVQEHIKNRLS